MTDEEQEAQEEQAEAATDEAAADAEASADGPAGADASASDEPGQEGAEGAEGESEEEPEDPPAEGTYVSEAHQPLLDRLREHLGDGIVDAATNHGDLVVRVKNEAWHQVAEVARSRFDCEYLSFISAIDWMPRPTPPTEDLDAPSMPAQPTEMTFGVTGSDGRFQVFACVASTDDKIELLFKTDVDESDPRVASWTDVYPGADWHERECWEMYGIAFDGHPHLRHLYLPGEFEGHPLRKDYPLLAREVKPWPGLVDVELMPEEEGEKEEEAKTSSGGEGE